MTGDVDAPFWWSDSTGDVHVAFTSAANGNLGVHVGDEHAARENRRLLTKRIGAEPRFLNQVHSNVVVDADHTTGESTGDGWVSQSGTPLAVMVADCLPVLFAGQTRSGGPVTAAAHAGRPGLLAGVLERTLDAMSSRGASDITAWLGPGACGNCYEIPEDMVRSIAADRPRIRSRTSWGTAALDLRAEATHIIDQRGVAVVDVPGCTIEDPTLFSHRRWQRTGVQPGRISGVIWCR